jgi:hypothetical protein
MRLRRGDAIAVLMRLENEPNCLESAFPFRRSFPFIPSGAGIYAGWPGLVRPLLRYDMG